MNGICEELNRQLGALYTCAPQQRYTRIRTPFLYPDGDVIDLYYVHEEGAGTLTDLGETVRWLRMQTIARGRTPRQQQLLQDVCQTYGVEFFKGTLSVRVHDDDSIAEALTRLSQACLRVADLWFTMRTRSVQSITDEVADFLTERGVGFELGEKLVGRSGRRWTVDFHTRTPLRSALVLVLATGSRAAARGVVEHVVTVWYDLNHLVVGPQPLRFVSLFDDTSDVWTQEDFSLVEDLSEVARWSRPDELEAFLRAA